MSQFRKFEEIYAWQEARKLTRAVRQICKRASVVRDFSFIDQITRSARSVGANIAEGNDAMTIPEFIIYLSYAKRSAAEVRAHLYDALDEKYITEEEFNTLAAQATSLTKMIAKLIHHLQSLDPKIKRTFSSNQPVNQ